jgi:hypothetical protein
MRIEDEVGLKRGRVERKEVLRCQKAGREEVDLVIHTKLIISQINSTNHRVTK